MQNPFLPHFPTEALGKEELERYSEELIKSYMGMRFTSPIQIQQSIRRIPVKLPPLESEQQIESVVLEPNHDEHENPTAKFSSEPPLAEIPFEADIIKESEPEHVEPEGPQRCFLHPKPKSSCKRCQTYLEWKQSTTNRSTPKKPR